MANILVVDDDHSVREFLRSTLEADGHRVSLAGGGEEALDVIRAHAFDCVMLDILMPDTDGFSVLRLMQTMPERARTPVIIITGRHDPEAVLRAMELGAVDHLAKPFPATDVEAALERALHGTVAERRDTLVRGAEAHKVAGALNRVARVSRLSRLADLLRHRRA